MPTEVLAAGIFAIALVGVVSGLVFGSRGIRRGDLWDVWLGCYLSCIPSLCAYVVTSEAGWWG